MKVIDEVQFLGLHHLFFISTKKEVGVISNTKTSKVISYKAKMGSKKLDSFFGKEEETKEEVKKE